MLQTQPVVLKEAVQVLNLALQGAQTPKSLLVLLLGLDASRAVEPLNVHLQANAHKVWYDKASGRRMISSELNVPLQEMQANA